MYINQQGIIYQGDMAIGDREATAEEVAVWVAARAPDPKDAIRAQIKSMEDRENLPRVTREFMLLTMEAQFAPSVLAQNIGYVNLKAFDAQIKTLRDQL